MAIKRSKAKSNKLNAQRSTGPRNTSNSRFNATRHGLLSTTIGAHEQALYDATLEEYRMTLLPENPLDDIFVRRIALYALRMERCATLAAELMESERLEEVDDVTAPSLLQSALEFSVSGRVPRRSLSDLKAPLTDIASELTRFTTEDGSDVDRPRLAAAAEAFAAAVAKLPRKSPAKIQAMNAEVDRLQRHETSYENRLIKFLNEYERVKRLRAGESIPAPVSVNVTRHGEE
jgi:hypothetical protein